MSEEKQISLISKYKTVETFVIGHFQDYQGMIDQIINANTQGQLVKRLKKACRKKIVQAGHGKVIDSKLEGINFKRYYVETVSDNQLKTLMRDLAYYNSTYQMTQDRLAQYKILNSRLYKNLDESSAKQILKVIHNLIDKSHASTIKNHYTNIIPMLNHVYAWYLENKLTPAQVPARAVYKIPQDTYLADLLPKATP